MDENALGEAIIGAAIEVHRELGLAFSNLPTKPVSRWNCLDAGWWLGGN